MIIKMPKHEPRTYLTLSAVEAFQKYWTESERLIGDAAHIEELLEGPKWTPTTEDEMAEHAADVHSVRHLHDEIVTPTFRYFAVVALYTIVERELRRLVDNLEKEKKAAVSYKEFRGDLFQQIFTYLKVFRGFSPSGFASYNQIVLLERVRHCIVHCYGDPTLIEDEKKKLAFLSLNAPKKGLEIFNGLSNRIRPKFIHSSHTATKAFFIELFSKIGWKVDDLWLNG